MLFGPSGVRAPEQQTGIIFLSLSFSFSQSFLL
jgi:hypothetical protein